MEKTIELLERIGIGLAVICVTLIMFIVSYDAVSRYALHAPLPWAFDLISYYLMAGAAYLGVSSTFRQGDHINIDLFRKYIPPVLRARLDALWSAIGIVVFGILTYGAGREMSHAFTRNEFMPGYIAWPAWISYLPIALGFALLTLRLTLHAMQLLVRGHDPEVAEPGDTLEEHHE